MLKAVYSTASAAWLAAFVAQTYGLPEPLDCALLQRGFNDNFDVTDGLGAALCVAAVLSARTG